MAAPPSEARLMPARISTPDAAVTLCSLSALASVAAVGAAELPGAGAPELGSSTEVTPNKIKGVSGGGGGGGSGGGGSGGEGLGRLCRTIGGCGAGGGGSGSGGGKGGCRFRGPQSVQSVPYAHEAPLDLCPPSWQMPFLTKGHSSRQTVGGGDGKGGSGGGGGGGDGGGGGGGCGATGGGGGCGGGQGSLPHMQQLCSGEPNSGPEVHSCAGAKPPATQWPSSL